MFEIRRSFHSDDDFDLKLVGDAFRRLHVVPLGGARPERRRLQHHLREEDQTTILSLSLSVPLGGARPNGGRFQRHRQQRDVFGKSDHTTTLSLTLSLTRQDNLKLAPRKAPWLTVKTRYGCRKGQEN